MMPNTLPTSPALLPVLALRSGILPGAPGSPEQRAYLLIQKVAAAQEQATAALFRTAGLSGPQFNVLRILRGAHEKAQLQQQEGGLSCSEISRRLIVQDPDVTRLLDRLEKSGYVRRERQKHDRRVILVFITALGLEALAPLDEPLNQLHAQQFAHLSPEQLRGLVEVLEGLLG